MPDEPRFWMSEETKLWHQAEHLVTIQEPKTHDGLHEALRELLDKYPRVKLAPGGAWDACLTHEINHPGEPCTAPVPITHPH